MTIQASVGSSGGSSYSTVDSIKSFTEDLHIVAFEKLFCEVDHGNDISNEGNKKISEQVIEFFVPIFCTIFLRKVKLKLICFGFLLFPLTGSVPHAGSASRFGLVLI